MTSKPNPGVRLKPDPTPAASAPVRAGSGFSLTPVLGVRSMATREPNPGVWLKPDPTPAASTPVRAGSGFSLTPVRGVQSLAARSRERLSCQADSRGGVPPRRPLRGVRHRLPHRLPADAAGRRLLADARRGPRGRRARPPERRRAHGARAGTGLDRSAMGRAAPRLRIARARRPWAARGRRRAVLRSARSSIAAVAARRLGRGPALDPARVLPGPPRCALDVHDPGAGLRAAALHGAHLAARVRGTKPEPARVPRLPAPRRVGERPRVGSARRDARPCCSARSSLRSRAVVRACGVSRCSCSHRSPCSPPRTGRSTPPLLPPAARRPTFRPRARHRVAAERSELGHARLLSPRGARARRGRLGSPPADALRHGRARTHVRGRGPRDPWHSVVRTDVPRARAGRARPAARRTHEAHTACARPRPLLRRGRRPRRRRDPRAGPGRRLVPEELARGSRVCGARLAHDAGDPRLRDEPGRRLDPLAHPRATRPPRLRRALRDLRPRDVRADRPLSRASRATTGSRSQTATRSSSSRRSRSRPRTSTTSSPSRARDPSTRTIASR